MKNPFVIEPKTRTQLARDYGVSLPTMNKWLKPLAGKLGKIRARILTAFQVGIVVKFIGLPKTQISLRDTF